MLPAGCTRSYRRVPYPYICDLYICDLCGALVIDEVWLEDGQKNYEEEVDALRRVAPALRWVGIEFLVV